MRTDNRTTEKRRKRLNLRMPEGKNDFFNDQNEMYPPVIQENKKGKKENLFIVDWQLPDNMNE